MAHIRKEELPLWEQFKEWAETFKEGRCSFDIFTDQCVEIADKLYPQGDEDDND